MSGGDEPEFRPIVDAALRGFGAMATFDAWAWLTNPGLVASGAYSFVRTVAPQPVWGAAFAVSAVLAAIALSGRVTGTVRHWAATAAFSLYGLCCGAVGLSIFVLTLNGTSSAITGATKWWIVFAISVRLMTWDYYDENTPIRRAR